MDFLAATWQLLAGVLTLFLSVITSAHVILYKRDTRAAVAWVGLVWLVPIIGSVLYVVLGINRIRRRATELRRAGQGLLAATTQELRQEHPVLRQQLPEESRHLANLASLVDRVTRLPLTAGNRVEPLVNGDDAYPEMIEAIDQAQHTAGLLTYIFDTDEAGLAFVDALERAVARGVSVRVLLDGVGARYSRPYIARVLKERGIPFARFLHSIFPWRMPFMNLRSHRKVLVIDGKVGFTGGMNIREACVLRDSPKAPTQDLHFRVDGPIVAHLMNVFAEDWAYTTHEVLDGSDWFPQLQPAGPVVARGIPDGPDEDFDKLRWSILGALAGAERRVRILTPYFLPDTSIVTSLNIAAMRGVEVDIIMPQVNNLPYVKWAAQAQLWQVLKHGCKVFLTRPPFDHSKVMLVDGGWALIGSANWDPRSLRLNFEFNVECYDGELASKLNRIVDEKLEGALPVTLQDVDGRSLPIKLRDGVARLFSPYL